MEDNSDRNQGEGETENNNYNELNSKNKEILKRSEEMLTSTVLEKEGKNWDEKQNDKQTMIDELLSKVNVLEKERNDMKTDGDKAEEERKAIKKERDAVREERDAMKEEIKLIIKENEVTSEENDALKEERDVITKERDAIKEEKDLITKEKDVAIEENDALKEERKVISKERDVMKLDNETLKSEKTALDTKYTALTSTLRDQVECPVCLEVPTSGPVPVCPNGHFVCSKCKDSHCPTRRVKHCPTCRVKMFSGKSLLAVKVIENIQHACRNEDCGKFFPLEEYKLHLTSCLHRTVNCPSPNEFCSRKMALSKVYDHILEDCQGSFNNIGNNNSNLNNGNIPKYIAVGSILKLSSKGLALKWNDKIFYLNLEKAPECYIFSLELFGTALECKDYEVSITVHRTNDKDMKGSVQRFTGKPLPIDTEQERRKKNGLLVGPDQMESLSVIDEKLKINFGITLDIKKQ
eukprot:GFUD01139240.1.p1 GENE.GFUD01139240.1~~GFUD01139240.1.p1  ORF type:complete len:465 (+),score=132.21 GFUD01139240.1:126-1520(+)